MRLYFLRWTVFLAKYMTLHFISWLEFSVVINNADVKEKQAFYFARTHHF